MGSYFLSYVLNISVENQLIDPVTLTFDFSSPKPYYKFEQFGIICFMRYAADKQTDRQTDGLERPTYVD